MNLDKCTIAIPTYRRINSLNNTLTSLISCTRTDEILIGVTGKIADCFDYITNYLISALQLTGKKVIIKENMTGCVNASLWFKEEATNDIILLLDDDVIITDKYLSLIDNFKDNNVGAVSGTLQTPCDINYKDWSNTPIELKDTPEIINTISFENNLLTIKNKLQVYMLKEPKILKCEVLVGSAILIRKNLFFPDINFEKGQCYFWEYDFTYNLKKKGYVLLYDSNAIAFHNREMQGGMRAIKEDKNENKLKATQYFKEKWNL